MNGIKIHVLDCGYVHTTRYLPFNKEHVGMLKVAGVGVPQKDWVWMPVACYYIEHPKGKILVDTGWSRLMSPDGKEDKSAQIRQLGLFLYMLNQGYTPEGKAVDEQLKVLGVETRDLDFVILTHLDCDHACGLHQVADAKRILVSRDEMRYARKPTPVNRVRYKKRWWKGIPLTLFDWNSSDGPFSRSYDLFGDGSVCLINIPGHCAGLCAVKITGADGRYVLLDADGAYSSRSWQEMVLPGIAGDRQKQIQSLEWIRQMSMDERCIESLATHDPAIRPHTIHLTSKP